MGVAVPRRYISIEDLAVARGIDPAKYTQGLGAREMAIAEPGEDTVALAALAGKRALDAAGNVELGMLVVGTETGVDHSKPVASFVHGLLELPQTMRAFDTQHACYGGTAGVMAAVEWIASGAAAGRAALVICSDVARYGMHTAGEPTQGAGAVAMVIAENPAMLELDVGVSGAASTHVHDFWRPIGQREARVDGHYSMQCYTDALATAYRGWKTRAIARELVQTSEQLARICYHVPFCKMAKKAHAALRACDGVADDVTSYQTQVEPSLWACSRVGNIYTGSLYLALLGALDNDAAALAGKRIGMFSYGSGCTSEFFSGVVGQRAAEMTAKAKLGEVLADRERITIDEYERIMTLVTPLTGWPLENRHAAFRFTGVDDHRRTYAR
jgi:hydroxymethylglutaryl-CoA synthase